jgi:N6-adenosine-specific RNA methylase IME4
MIPPRPKKLYDVIYCDPPWRRSNDVPKSSVDNHYSTMTTEKICAMKVPAAENCILFMWTIVPMQREAFEVLDAWGFEYKSQLVWYKNTRMGCGWWVRNNHEPLFIATRGKCKLPPPKLRIPSVFCAPRSRHSSKPDQIRDWIAKWNPGNKLEMFAREYTGFWPKPEGWDTFGSEVKNDVEI